jgi:hypothetical protein
MLKFWVLVLASSTLLALAASEARSQEKGCRFVPAEPILKPVWNDPVLGKSGKYDPGDYEMQLMEDFSYIDCALQKHTVKAGTVVNGASIPRPAWSVLGYTPWDGPVQKPSIIHDDLCARALFTSDQAHLVFHEALIHSGLSPKTAALMYAAVLNFGPQWSKPGGPVSQPTYVGGVMNLIAKAIRDQKIISRLSRDRITDGYIHYWYELSPELPPLTGAEQDAKIVRDILKQARRVSPEEAEELVRDGVTRERWGPLNSEEHPRR